MQLPKSSKPNRKSVKLKNCLEGQTLISVSLHNLYGNTFRNDIVTSLIFKKRQLPTWQDSSPLIPIKLTITLYTHLTATLKVVFIAQKTNTIIVAESWKCTVLNLWIGLTQLELGLIWYCIGFLLIFTFLHGCWKQKEIIQILQTLKPLQTFKEPPKLTF